MAHLYYYETSYPFCFFAINQLCLEFSRFRFYPKMRFFYTCFENFPLQIIYYKAIIFSIFCHNTINTLLTINSVVFLSTIGRCTWAYA